MSCHVPEFMILWRMHTHTYARHWNFSQDIPHPALSRRDYGLFGNLSAAAWSHIHQLSSYRRSCLPLCWRHIVIKGYYVSHVILFSSLLLTTKRGELAVVFIRTLRGEWWRSRHIVYWHMIVIKMTLQNNSTVKRGRNRCVCLRLACLCMSVYGCTDTTRG